MKKNEKVEIVCPVCGSETMIRSSLLNTTFNPFYCLKCNSLYLVTVDEKTKQPISKKWEDVVKSDKSGMETVTIEKPKNEPSKYQGALYYLMTEILQYSPDKGENALTKQAEADLMELIRKEESKCQKQ